MTRVERLRFGGRMSGSMARTAPGCNWRRHRVLLDLLEVVDDPIDQLIAVLANSSGVTGPPYRWPPRRSGGRGGPGGRRARRPASSAAGSTPSNASPNSSATSANQSARRSTTTGGAVVEPGVGEGAGVHDGDPVTRRRWAVGTRTKPDSGDVDICTWRAANASMVVSAVRKAIRCTGSSGVLRRARRAPSRRCRRSDRSV